MSVREYIGARYVPIFGRKDETSIAWDDSKPYEPLTIVLYQGNSYTSRQYVPAGIPITNETYWALTGNYNAQVEAYRNEVQGFRDDIDQNTEDIADLNGDVTTLSGNLTTQTGRIDTLENTTIPAMQDDISDLQEVIGVTYAPVTRNYTNKNMVVLGDSYTAPNIDNSADAYWARRVAAAYSMNLFNYAVAGAGWGRTSQLISAQQTACDAAMTADQKNNTAVVIAMAGVNDLLNDVDAGAIQSGITSFAQWANREFPNAQVLIVPFAFGFGGITDGYRQIMTNSLNSVMATLQYNGVKLLPYAYMWNIGIASRFRNQVHPNEAGYRVIAGHIINAIEGGAPLNNGTAGYVNLADNAAISAGGFSYYVADGVVHLHGFARPAAAGASTATIFSTTGYKAPAILTPYYPSFILVPCPTVGASAAAAQLRINTDGGCTIAFPSTASTSTNYTWDYSYPVVCGREWSDSV